MLLGGDGWDVPRNSQGVALIGDPRDDVHLFINQLHVALLHARNGLVGRLRADGECGPGAGSDEAGPERTVLLRQRQEVQEVLRSLAAIRGV